MLLTVIPLTYIVKTTIDKSEETMSFLQFMGAMTRGTYYTLLFFLIGSFLIAHYFRKEGLRHIHESET